MRADVRLADIRYHYEAAMRTSLRETYLGRAGDVPFLLTLIEKLKAENAELRAKGGDNGKE